MESLLVKREMLRMKVSLEEMEGTGGGGCVQRWGSEIKEWKQLLLFCCG